MNGLGVRAMDVEYEPFSAGWSDAIIAVASGSARANPIESSLLEDFGVIGNAVHALLAHPEPLRRVARDLARVPDLVEETLRFDAPIQIVFRTATRDVELAGVRIPQGSVVAPLLGSANRDERAFPEPDRFDLERRARGHLAFGLGVHFCLGAALARLEARVALEALVPELPRCEPVGDPPEWVDSFLVRGRRRLELAPA